jgi:hypothetical protein
MVSELSVAIPSAHHRSDLVGSTSILVLGSTFILVSGFTGSGCNKNYYFK